MKCLFLIFSWRVFMFFVFVHTRDLHDIMIFQGYSNAFCIWFCFKTESGIWIAGFRQILNFGVKVLCCSTRYILHLIGKLDIDKKGKNYSLFQCIAILGSSYTDTLMLESKSDLQVWKHFSKKKKQNPDSATSDYQNVIIWQKRKLVPYPMRLLISDRTEKWKELIHLI